MGGKHKYDPEKRETESPAVKYVKKQRALHHDDFKESETLQYTSKAQGVAIKEGCVYFNPIHQERVWMTKKAICKICEDLCEWAINDPEALKVTLFFNDRGITWDVVDDWRKKFPNFDSAYKIALQAIGDRREIGAVKRILDSNIVKYTLPLYDVKVREMEFERALLKIRAEEEIAQESRVKYIVMPPIETSPIVKERPRDENEENKTDL